MSQNKVNGPADAVVSEMIKQLLQEKIYTLTRCFQERFMGQMEAPGSWKIVKLVFLRKPDAKPKKGIRSFRAVVLTSVMSKWYASCIVLRLEKQKEPQSWKKLHVGGVDGISCQHLQVMMTNVLEKHREWLGGKDSHVEAWQCGAANKCFWQAWTSRRRSMRQDRGTSQKNMENHNTHAWMDYFGLLARHGWLRRPGDVRMRGGQFLIQSVSPPRKRRSSQIVAKDGHAAPGKCGGELDKEKYGHPFGLGRTKGTSEMQFHVGRQLVDHVPLQNSSGTDAAGSDSGSREVGFGPKTGESVVDKFS